MDKESLKEMEMMMIDDDEMKTLEKIKKSENDSFVLMIEIVEDDLHQAVENEVLLKKIP